MNILMLILFGAIVGILSYFLDTKPNGRGLLGSVLLGITGALTGGTIASLLFSSTLTGFNFQIFSISLLGSLMLLTLSKALRKV